MPGARSVGGGWAAPKTGLMPFLPGASQVCFSRLSVVTDVIIYFAFFGAFRFYFLWYIFINEGGGGGG